MAVREIFPALSKASDLIGRILMAYSELEVGLMHCLNSKHDEFDYIFKEIFTRQGAEQRLNKAKEIGEPTFSKTGLGKDFETAMSHVHHCREIRNQYAHNYWYDKEDSDVISFVPLEKRVEEIKKTDEILKDFSCLQRHQVNIKLLEDQLDYFDYTERFLLWLRAEFRTRNNLQPRNPWRTPLESNKPKLYL